MAIPEFNCRWATFVAIALSWAGWGPALGAAQPPPFETVLARASAYADGYGRRLATIVARESYDQRVTDSLEGAGHGPTPLRRLRSSFLLVESGDGRYTAFRDVFEVDGVAVHDRHDRLAALFAPPSRSGAEQARLLTEASTRYNLSDVVRSINVPTFALVFLHTAQLRRSVWRDRGYDQLSGHRVRVLEFVESAADTVVTRDGARNLPSSGRFSVDEDRGIVVRSRHDVRDGTYAAQVSVDYTEQPSLSLWMPTRMEEVYREQSGARVVLGTARYTDFQRVGVSSSAVIEPPRRKPPAQ